MKSKLKTTAILLLVLPLLLLAIKKIIDLRKGAAGTPANIVVDVNTPQGPVPSSLWQNLAQGGEEPADMVGPVISQVRSLEPQLIRIDHIFDYFNVYQGPNNYNFSLLDKAVDSILRTGARPMLSVSYTTSSMSKNGQSAGEPADWNQWYELVKATAKHYSVDKNISGIYYEVWNEPDLFGGWHYAKSPSYSTLYTQTAQAITQGASGTIYKVGGPAITAYYPSWIKALFKLASTNHLPLDFISWHKYSKNPSDYLKDFDTLNGILADYPQYFNIERLITETGPNSEPDPWYDNQLSGIHLMSLSTQLAGKIHRLFTFEITDGPTKRSDKSTGWGIITHPSSGIKLKPRFHAIRFLNQLGGTRLTTIGDGSHVTSLASINNKTIQLLLVNYDPQNSHAETFPISIQGMSAGNYLVKISYFLGSSSTQNATIGFNYRRNFFLEPNSAALIELTPQ